MVRAGEGSLPRGLVLALAELGAAADRLDRHRLDHQLLGAVDEAEARLVGLLEGGFHFGERAGFDHQRRVGAGVADMGADDHLDLGGGHALAGDLGLGVLAEPAALALDGGERLGAEIFLDGLLAGGADVGQAHAVGRQQRRERVDQHLGHAERVGDQAGVLAAGAAEAVQRIAGDVVAALHRDFLDRVGHVLDRDLDEAVGDLFRRFAADLFGQFGEGLLHGVGVERLVLVRAENLREEIGDELADQHIGVGDGERAAAAVAFRAGIGAGGIRADAEARPIEVQHRAAAGRDRVNEHHRRAHAHARDLGLEGALVFAVVVRHVGGGAAHVEADQILEAGFAAGLGHADHAAGGAGQDRVLALEQLGGGEAARRHHEHQADVVFCFAARRSLLPPPLRGEGKTAPQRGRCSIPRRRLRHSGAGSARGTRRPRWCRRGPPV